jgi:hypothetical protein
LGELLRTISTGDKHVLDMACSADGVRAATVGTDGTVRVWDLPSGTQRATVQSPAANVRALALLGNSVRWGTARRQVFSWPMDGEPAAIDLPGEAPATCYDLVERGGWSLAGLAHGELRLFGSAGAPAEFGVPGCGPAALARSLGGDLILVVGGLPQMASDNTVRVWRTADLTSPLAAFVGDMPFTAAAMSGDGRRVYLGDASGAVLFLELVGT